MSTESLVRKRQDCAATFVERKDEAVVVTIGAERVETPVSEWERLPSWDGEVPSDFAKPPRKTAD